MKKRILSLMLALVLALSLLPMPALAEETLIPVTQIPLTGIVQPVGWDKVAQTVNLPEGYGYSATVRWYEDGKSYPTSSFESDYGYTCVINIVLENTGKYIFPQDISKDNVTINGTHPDQVTYKDPYLLEVRKHYRASFPANAPKGSLSDVTESITLSDRKTSIGEIAYTYSGTGAVIATELSYREPDSIRDAWISLGDTDGKILPPHNFTSRTYRLGVLVEKDGVSKWFYTSDIPVTVAGNPVVSSIEAQLSAPARWEAPAAAGSITAGESVIVSNVTWSPAVLEVFEPDTAYTAELTFTAAEDYTLDETLTCTVKDTATGNELTGERISLSETTAVFRVTFPKTAAAPTGILTGFAVQGTRDAGLFSEGALRLILTEDTFKDAMPAGTDVSGWFLNLPAGLSAKLSADVPAGGDAAEMTFSGVPTVEADAAMALVIPAPCLQSDRALTVRENENARFDIAGSRETLVLFGLTYSSREYNSQPIAPQGTLVVEGGKVSASALEVRYTGTGSTQYDSTDAPAEAGTYRATWRIPDSNVRYAGSVSYDFEISPLTLLAPMISEAWRSVPYTGSAVNITDYFTVLDESVMTVSGDLEKTETGKYSVTVSLLDARNYQFSDGSSTIYLTWEIVPAVVPVPEIPEAQRSASYTGSSIDITGAVTGFDSAIMTLSGETSGTEAGKYAMTVSLKDTKNYAFAGGGSTARLTWEIVPAVVPVPEIPEAWRSVAYTGETIDITRQLTGFDETLMTLSGDTEKRLPGKYTLTVSLKDAKNYVFEGGGSTTWLDWRIEGGELPAYVLRFETNGGSAIDSIIREEGDVILLSGYETRRTGYVFDGWYADAALTRRITEVTLTRDTIVYAGWKKEATPSGELPFTDVKEDDWFHDDVEYVHDRGLMQGESATRFSPDAAVTRGMMVTVLYRLAGEPAVSGSCPFSDVTSGSYYEKAVIWAAETGVVKGYGDGRYGPNDRITREQLAAILFRYAQLQGVDVSERDELSAYTDAGSVSGYALEAMEWATCAGLVNGMGGGLLNPKGGATRAQAAAILHRFCENIVK